MGGMDIGRRRAATPPLPVWLGLVPVRAGLVIDFCTSPVRTGNSTYPAGARGAWERTVKFLLGCSDPCLNCKEQNQVKSATFDFIADTGRKL